MGWRGTVRSIVAVSRRIERDRQRQERHYLKAAARQEREIAKFQKELDKEMARANAAQEVEEYESEVERLTSVHRDCGDTIDWASIRQSGPPEVPERSRRHEAAASLALESFRPSFFQKLFKKDEAEVALLESKVLYAAEQDEDEYQRAYQSYLQKHQEWIDQVALAAAILAGDLRAYEEAINELNPFADISDFGSSISFKIPHWSFVEVEIKVNGEHVIPKEEKRLLQSGKISVKAITQRKFYELYQDYVCGCALRVAREVFALLPAKYVLVHAEADMLDRATGHIDNFTVLSVSIPRETESRLNWHTVDASDSMKNFVHMMGFRRGEGFSPVERIKAEIDQPSGVASAK